MRLSALLASLTFLALAFAGCSGGDGDGGSTSTSSSASQTSSASSSTSRSATATTTSSGTTSAAPANQPPTGSLSAVVNGTEAAFTLTGADADGDELSWELDFGDGSPEATGTDLPADVIHGYDVGNYTAKLTLSDGTEETRYEVPVGIAAIRVGEPLQTASGGWAIGVSDSGASSEIAACGTSPLSGVTHLHFAVDAATQGKAFTATITDASAGAAIQDWGILFFEEGCLAFEDASTTGPAPIAGTVPAAAAIAVVIATGGAELEFTYAAG